MTISGTVLSARVSPQLAATRHPARAGSSCHAARAVVGLGVTRMPGTGRRGIRRHTGVLACSASRIQVATMLSGLSEIDVIPRPTSQSAKSGWSDGPCPQMPT